MGGALMPDTDHVEAVKAALRGLNSVLVAATREGLSVAFQFEHATVIREDGQTPCPVLSVQLERGTERYFCHGRATG
jgi:hypothetical protein